METPELPTGIRELPVVAGDLALDFANTVDDPLGPERHDHVADYQSLLWWSVRVGVLTEADADRLTGRSAPRRTAEVVRRAHRLRGAINLTAGTLADQQARAAHEARAGGARRSGTGTPAEGAGLSGVGTPAEGAGRSGAGGSAEGAGLVGWEELRGFVSEAVANCELVGGRPVWPFERLGSPLWPVALAAFELLTGPRARRIKRCAGCPWLFLDQSKNGSRRWCSMEICGTNEKMRLYVSRRAARRSRS